MKLENRDKFVIVVDSLIIRFVKPHLTTPCTTVHGHCGENFSGEKNWITFYGFIENNSNLSFEDGRGLYEASELQELQKLPQK